MASNRVQVTQTVAANLKVDPSAVTSPVSVASLPLPAGAATAALQGGGMPAALGAGGGVKVDGSGTALPVSGTVTATVGTVTAVTSITNVVHVDDNSGSLTVDSPQLPAALGGTTSSASLPVVLSSDGPFATQTGSVTETAPASDTASSGLNGRLQRIAQRLTSLIALLPTALGSGGGLKVDGSGTALPVSGTVTANAGTGTLAVSAASLPLPTGAATAAKQPALGTAGTASADVITVQGVASGLPVYVDTKQVNISQTPTVSTSPAYTAADALGGLLTFANAARLSGGTGYITAVTILCKTPALVPAIDLVLFNQTFTATADNAAFAPSDADMANCIGYIPLTAWSDNANNSIAVRFGLGFPFTLAGTSLFGQLVIRSAVTMGSTTDIIVGIQVTQD